jgi:hypothetical protein
MESSSAVVIYTLQFSTMPEGCCGRRSTHSFRVFGTSPHKSVAKPPTAEVRITTIAAVDHRDLEWISIDVAELFAERSMSFFDISVKEYNFTDDRCTASTVASSSTPFDPAEYFAERLRSIERSSFEFHRSFYQQPKWFNHTSAIRASKGLGEYIYRRCRIFRRLSAFSVGRSNTNLRQMARCPPIEHQGNCRV